MSKTAKPPHANEVEAPEAEVPEVAAPKKVWLQSVHGQLLHLYTSVLFTFEPKQHVIDDFVQAQLDAGKLIEFKE